MIQFPHVSPPKLQEPLSDAAIVEVNRIAESFKAHGMNEVKLPVFDLEEDIERAWGAKDLRDHCDANGLVLVFLRRRKW